MILVHLVDKLMKIPGNMFECPPSFTSRQTALSHSSLTYCTVLQFPNKTKETINKQDVNADNLHGLIFSVINHGMLIAS